MAKAFLLVEYRSKECQKEPIRKYQSYNG